MLYSYPLGQLSIEVLGVELSQLLVGVLSYQLCVLNFRGSSHATGHPYGGSLPLRGCNGKGSKTSLSTSLTMQTGFSSTPLILFNLILNARTEKDSPHTNERTPGTQLLNSTLNETPHGNANFRDQLHFAVSLHKR